MALHLTFDDGPAARTTPAVLGALGAVGAKATFFVLGDAVLEHPGLVRETLAAGHRVELHGMEHRRHDRLTREEIRDDAQRALGVLGALGVRPAWWRTPWGRVTDDTRAVAAELGLALVGWDADTHDWRGDAAVEQLRRVEEDAPHGGIVLAHDALGPGATRPDCRETAAFVGLVATWARARGLDLEPLPDPATSSVPPGLAAPAVATSPSVSPRPAAAPPSASVRSPAPSPAPAPVGPRA